MSQPPSVVMAMAEPEETPPVPASVCQFGEIYTVADFLFKPKVETVLPLERSEFLIESFKEQVDSAGFSWSMFDINTMDPQPRCSIIDFDGKNAQYCTRMVMLKGECLVKQEQSTLFQYLREGKSQRYCKVYAGSGSLPVTDLFKKGKRVYFCSRHVPMDYLIECKRQHESQSQ